jgi:hypothetical protein
VTAALLLIGAGAAALLTIGRIARRRQRRQRRLWQCRL